MPNSELKFKVGSQDPVMYDNTVREVIQIMPDTLDNRLRDFEDSVRQKRSIFHDFGLAFAFLGTLVTVSQFKAFLGIPPNVWQAGFMIFFGLTVLQLFRDIYSSCFLKTVTREGVIKQLLNETKKKI